MTRPGHDEVEQEPFDSQAAIDPETDTLLGVLAAELADLSRSNSADDPDLRVE